MRQVTERDLRRPGMEDSKPEEFEFREDGELVRKDRWQQGIRRIAAALRTSRNFDINDIVGRVEETMGDWYYMEEGDDDDMPWVNVRSGIAVDFLLEDGSVLMGLTPTSQASLFEWKPAPLMEYTSQILLHEKSEGVVAWRRHRPKVKPVAVECRCGYGCPESKGCNFEEKS